MRSYIFTKSERRRLLAWLKEDVEDDTTRMIFVAIRRNFDSIKVDLELLTLVTHKLVGKGRYMRRVRLPGDISSRYRDLMKRARAIPRGGV